MDDSGSYRRLDHVKVQDTVEDVGSRIRRRFPASGLGAVANELAELVPHVARESRESSQRSADLFRRARLGAAALATAAVAALVGAVWADVAAEGPFQWGPLIESSINLIVFAAVATLFLWAIPQRAQRQRMLRLLHQLRSLAHVVDMHQLTKDPEQREAAFVVPQVGAELLRQYLSYCSELLSLVGKAAALCAEESQDPLVLASVGDLETMTAELSQTIWQKISALPQDVSSPPPIPPE